MKKALLLLIISTLTVSVYSQGWSWHKQFDGNGDKTIYASIRDAQDNLYILGRFNNTMSIEGNSLTSAGDFDIFLARLDADGNLTWLRQIGGPGSDIPWEIDLDNTESNIIITGMHSDQCAFESQVISSTDGSDIFLAKYSVDGNLVWTKNAGSGIGTQRPGGLKVDNSNNILLIGSFQNSIDFGSGNTLTCVNTLNHFLAKFNSSGTLLWAKQYVAKSNVSFFKKLVIGNDGYYLSGFHRDTLFLDIETLTAETTRSNMFLYKTDFNGNGLWVRSFKGNNDENPQSIDLDAFGNVFFTGDFRSTNFTIDSLSGTTSAQTFSNQGLADIVLAKYSSTGQLLFAKVFGSSSDDKPNFIKTQGNLVALTGYYSGNISFGDYDLNSTGGTEAFYVEMSTDGNISEALTAGGSSNDYGKTCMFNTHDNMIVLGNYTSDQFHIGNDVLTNPNPGTNNVFVSKYGCIEALSLTSNPVSCVDGMGIPLDNDGSASVSVSGGREPYSYAWSDGQTTQTATNLGNETYTVTVTDASNCVSTGSITVEVSDPLAVTIDSITTQACTGEGYVSVLANNGKTPYTYVWSTGSTASSISGLNPGTYRVTVSDQCGNTIVETATISGFPTLTASISSTNVICRNTATGSATATPSGGKTPYTYVWSNGGTTQTINNLTSGTYRVTITDDCGKTTTRSKTITQPAALAATTFAVSVSCPTSSDGSASVSPYNGTAPYSYIWSTGATTQSITNVPAALYRVTITDDCGATIVKSVRVKAPKTMKVTSTVNCTNTTSCTGSATVTISGGTSPYTYLWSDPSNQTTQTATNLCVGTYSVTVTDAAGCTVVKSNIKVKKCTKDQLKFADIEEEDITPGLYPNPASDFVNLFVDANDDEKVVIEAYDILGKQVYYLVTTGSNHYISTSDWENGVFIIRISHNEETTSHRLVVVH